VEEGAAVILCEAERMGEVVEGDRIMSKFKKTQDVIWTEGGFGRHAEVPFWERGSGQDDFSHFFENRCNFFQVCGVSYAGQHTTD